MVAKTGDKVRFRDVSGEHRLTGVSNDGIVQYEVGDKIYTTDVSEIVHNYHEAARTRASLQEGLRQSAEGDVAYLGDFSEYLAEDKMPDPL